MNEFFQSFSNREISIVIWSIIFIVFLLLKSNPNGLIKQIFQKQIILLFLIIFLYLAIIIVLLKKAGVWETALYKDFLIWFFTVGMVTVFNSNNLKKYSDFLKVVLKQFSISFIIEYLVCYYTFSLIVELFIVPVFTILFAILAYSNYYSDKESYKNVSKFLNAVLSFAGILVLFHTVYSLAQSYSAILTLLNIKLLLLFPFFTLLFLPFIYLIIIYMKYEDIFSILRRYKFIDKKRKRAIKNAIMLYGNLNLINLEKAKKIVIFNKRELQDEIKIYNYIKAEITNVK